MSVTVRAHGAAEFRQSPEWRWNCSSAAGGLGHVVRLLWLSANRGDSCPMDWWFAIASPVYATALATGLRSRSAFLGVRSSANLRRWSLPYMVRPRYIEIRWFVRQLLVEYLGLDQQSQASALPRALQFQCNFFWILEARATGQIYTDPKNSAKYQISCRRPLSRRL